MNLRTFSSWSVIVLSLAAVVGGCGPQAYTATGTRPPTNPADVEIYQKEPQKYEKLGFVEVPVGGDVRWDANGDATPGFEKLKAAAAKRGANGILLVRPSADMGSVVAGYKGKFYQVPARLGEPKVVAVQAIYVIEP